MSCAEARASRAAAGGAPVDLTGRITDEQLDALMRGADALVHPSLYEGFGLVVVEAMARGCPVVCSNATALPETGGDAARYFDPLDVDDMADAIHGVVTDRVVHENLARLGRRARGDVHMGGGGRSDRRRLPRAGRVKVAVPIVSTDEGELLRRCLPAVLAQPDVDVVVCDNASADSTAEVAREHGVRCVRFEQRLDFARAMNAALARGRRRRGAARCSPTASSRRASSRPRGRGSPSPTWARSRRSSCGRRARTRPTGSTCSTPPAWSWTGGARTASSATGAPRWRTTRPARRSAPTARSRCTGVRRSTTARSTGRSSTRTSSAWASDADLAWRVRLLGWRCAYEPRALAFHIRAYSPSTRARMPEPDRRMQFRNRYLMIAKNDPWPGPAARPPAHRAYELLALGHALLRERHLLRGYVEAARLLPRMARKRRELQRRRRELAARPAGAASAIPYALEPRP